MAFIGAESLTDAEYATIDLDTQSYDLESYTALLGVVDSRETVSNTRDRLTSYFTARGVEITEPAAAQSNIFIGGSVCS